MRGNMLDMAVGIIMGAAFGTIITHAGRQELLCWLSAFNNNPRVFVVHGEEETSLSFAELIRERYGFVTHAPSRGESFEL
jgi:metallo-beta-lactamase family protein